MNEKRITIQDSLKLLKLLSFFMVKKFSVSEQFLEFRKHRVVDLRLFYKRYFMLGYENFFNKKENIKHRHEHLNISHLTFNIR